MYWATSHNAAKNSKRNHNIIENDENEILSVGLLKFQFLFYIYVMINMQQVWFTKAKNMIYEIRKKTMRRESVKIWI